ncbi:hypothetical protein AO065_15085 [Pseudomonas viridiflava]|nr:hypothetical protein PVFL_09865 [Pseudomonas viridiflava]OAG90956.1 hypothetical protein AO065_15085 [Pseudomonas viridiflava]
MSDAFVPVQQLRLGPMQTPEAKLLDRLASLFQCARTDGKSIELFLESRQNVELTANSCPRYPYRFSRPRTKTLCTFTNLLGKFRIEDSERAGGICPTCVDIAILIDMVTKPDTVRSI